ncbi:MAG: amphi-Trp domain-containing protein [Gammaproteobacteria bacterium]|nr:amphi-Trp domain-containing protein [Gammaproteobacteria bacterium]
MKNSKSNFRHESIQDNKSILAILKAITKGIEKNELTFSDEEDTIIMHPRGLLALKVSASQDGNDNRVNIRIKWQTEPDKKKQKSSLSIT